MVCGGLRTSHLTRFRAAKRTGCTGMQSESGFFKALAKIAEGWNTKKQWKTAGSKFSLRNWISRSEKYILYFFCENDADTCCFLYPNGNLGQNHGLGIPSRFYLYDNFSLHKQILLYTIRKSLQTHTRQSASHTPERTHRHKHDIANVIYIIHEVLYLIISPFRQASTLQNTSGALRSACV